MLTNKGYEIITLDEILSSLSTGQKNIFPDLNLDPSTPDGQLNGLIGEAIALGHEIGLSMYNGLDPMTAEGVMLDRLCALNGITRLQSNPTEVIVTFTGADGSVIPAKTSVSATSINGVTFLTTDTVTIDSSGDISVNAVASEDGTIAVPVGAINTIDNPVSGVVSVTNLQSGAIGRLKETDQQLRIRRLQSLAILSTSLVDSLYAKIGEVNGVTAVRVYENKEQTTDADGTPPNTVWCIVEGGTDYDVADAIMRGKSLGCGLRGATVVQWADANDFNNNVYFDRPDPVTIYIKVTAKAYDAWSIAYANEIKANILQYIADVRVGAVNTGEKFSIGDECVSSSFYPPIVGSEQYRIDSIYVGDVYPATELFTDIPINGIGFYDEVNIEVIGS